MTQKFLEVSKASSWQTTMACASAQEYQVLGYLKLAKFGKTSEKGLVL
jgi:hypothetical protein